MVASFLDKPEAQASESLWFFDKPEAQASESLRFFDKPEAQVSESLWFSFFVEFYILVHV